jgi:peptidoglycan/LPS O-acetylase OafA/YrhL
MPVTYAVLSRFLGPNYLRTPWDNLDFIMLCLLSLGVAEVSWRFIEAPLNNLKRRQAG